MRVLWVGDSPTLSSGFGRCTREVCAHLHTTGHDIHVLGLWFYGDPHTYPYPIYPCANPLKHAYNDFGLERIAQLTYDIKPDIIVILNDPWNVEHYLQALKVGLLNPKVNYPIPPVVAWLAVDSRNQHATPLNDPALAHVAVWTQFAADELRSGGYNGECSIVPLGVDTSLFYPRDKVQSRVEIINSTLSIPSDAWIVGSVGTNQLRKRLDLTIEYFAQWVHDYDIDDAYLYLHVGPTGDMGVDIDSLCHYHNIGKRVIKCSPPVGAGAPEDYMPKLYSCFDLYLSTSQAEGWGLPCLEAMACGVPCAVPNFAAFDTETGWVGDCTLPIECPTSSPTAPVSSTCYTLGGIVGEESTINALRLAYEYCGYKDGYALLDRGIELAKSLSWSSTTTRFEKVLISCLKLG